MNILDVLQSLTLKQTIDYGPLFLFSDIQTACKNLGYTDPIAIQTALLELDQQNKIDLIYMKDFGFEDLLVGVKLR